MTTWRLLSLATLAASLSTAAGQAPRPPAAAPEQGEVTLRVTVNLVQVDAVVTDRQGRVVSNLERQDFELLQDGRPQKITHFSFVNLVPPPPPQTAAAPEGPRPPAAPRRDQIRRTMALVVDDLGLSFESFHHVREALKRFAGQHGEEGDMVAVLRTSRGGAWQGFTSDRRQLLATIERLQWLPLGRSGVQALAPIEDGAAAPQAEAATPGFDADSFTDEYFSTSTLGALSYIVRGLRELPGRKSVVLFSDNLRIFAPGGTSDRVLDAIRELTDLANRSSVVIYTMDARGLPALGLTARDDVSSLDAQTFGETLLSRLQQRRAEFIDSQDGLNYLAHQTGGLFLHNSNDLAAELVRVMEDQSGYYLLGYTPDSSTFDAETGRRLFHKIQVKVRVPRLQVRSGTGFYGVPDPPPPAGGGVQPVVAALLSPFGSGDVRLKLTSLFSHHGRGGSFARLLLHIDGRDLSFLDQPDDWHEASMEVAAATFGEDGTPLDPSHRVYTLRVRGEDYRKAREHGLVYTLNHPVKKPGPYHVRAAVLDSRSKRIGSAGHFLEIPDLGQGRLTLSGILVRSLTAAPDQPSDQEGRAREEDPQANAAVRVFRSGAVMRYAFQILNAQVDKRTRRPKIETQLRLFREGRLLVAGRTAPFDPGKQNDYRRLVGTGRLSLGKPLEPGGYVLEVIVNDLLAKTKNRAASQWIDFEIAP